MKHLDVTELASAVAIPVAMTRREKLLHWARLIRATDRPLMLYHGLEYLHPEQLRAARVTATDPTAFGVAAADRTFREQGLPAESSIREVMGFFEVTQQQLHEFSCDCGGSISNGSMASRIERIAG